MPEHDAELKNGDYLLVDERAWFTVKNFAVWIRSTDEGVVVDIYKNGDVLSDSLASTYAFDSETLEEQDL